MSHSSHPCPEPSRLGRPPQHSPRGGGLALVSASRSVSPGGVISYIGSSGSSPSRTSPVSLCSDSSNGSFQSGSQAFPSYFPPSPTGSLTHDSRPYGAGLQGSREDGSPSSLSSSSSSSYSSSGTSPGGLQVAMDDGRRVSPSKTTSNITSECWRWGGHRVWGDPWEGLGVVAVGGHWGTCGALYPGLFPLDQSVLAGGCSLDPLPSPAWQATYLLGMPCP